MDAGSWFLLLLGPCIGSLVGVLVRRLPAGRPVLLDRSRCEACGAPLGMRDLLPLVSFVLLRGRCRRCGAAIAPMHVWAELAGLAMAASVLLTMPADGALRPLSCVLGGFLLALGWLDALHLWLPDALTWPLLFAGLGATALLDPSALPDHALAAALGYGLLRAVALVFVRLRGREGLGAGDAKLLAAIGAWGGVGVLGPAILLAAGLGLGMAAVLALRGRAMAEVELPFGAFLAAAFWALWLVI